MSDFFFAHSDFLHDLVAFSVIIPFRYLFVVDDECRCHQEYDSEEDTDEEKPLKCIVSVCSKKAYKAVEKAKKFHSARNMSYSQGNRMGKRSADCSSFCGRCYLPQGITMGGSTSWCNTAAGMALWSTKKGKVVANSGVSIGKKKLLPGDLVFYKKGYNGRYKNIYHVEIFVGYEWRNNQLVGYTMSSITGNYPSILKRDYTSRKGRVAQIARPAQ